MKKQYAVFFLLVGLLVAAHPVAAKKAVFGPKKYDVKERFGKENRYHEDFRAAKGRYVLKIRNGEQWPQRPDFMELTLNGQPLLKEAKYAHPYIACFVELRKKNSFDLAIRDVKPSSFRRPKLPPRFVYVTVLPVRGTVIPGVFGGVTWDALTAYIGSIRKIGNRKAAGLAAKAANLQNDTTVRAEAVRNLSDRKETGARDFLFRLFGDVADKPEVRAEAALAIGALGSAQGLPLLFRELLNPDPLIRTASARALSFYPEKDTRDLLTKRLTTLDPMRRAALMRTLTESGWKPVGTLVDLAGSADPYVANMAVEILGGLQDPRATDQLLTLIHKPGNKDVKIIITALGRSKDPRAVEPLVNIAQDPDQSSGKEIELAQALANLGDQRGAKAITRMMKQVKTARAKQALGEAYKKLTGKK